MKKNEKKKQLQLEKIIIMILSFLSFNFVNIHIVKINVFSSAPELTAENKMIPVLNYGIKCMSIGLLVNLNIFNLIDVI